MKNTKNIKKNIFTFAMLSSLSCLISNFAFAQNTENSPQMNLEIIDSNVDVSKINQQPKLNATQHQAGNGGVAFQYQDNATKIVESNDDPLMRSVKVKTGFSNYEFIKPNDTSIGSTKEPQKRMSTFKVMDF